MVGSLLSVFVTPFLRLLVFRLCCLHLFPVVFQQPVIGVCRFLGGREQDLVLRGFISRDRLGGAKAGILECR